MRCSLWLAVALSVACGGSSDSPTTPSPAVPFQLAFTPETTQPPSVSLSLRALTPSEPGRLDLQIWAEGLFAAHRVDGEIHWNPTVVQFDSADPSGSILIQGKPHALSHVEPDNTIGRLSFSVSTMGDGPVSGAGHLLTTRFRASKTATSGASTPLNFSDGGQDGELMATFGGTISISQ